MSQEDAPFATPPPPVAPEPEEQVRKPSRLTRAALYTAIAPLVGFGSCVAHTTYDRYADEPLAALALLGMAGGVVGTIMGLVAFVRALRNDGAGLALLAVLANAGLVAATFLWGLDHISFGHGRQLVRGGRGRLPGERPDRRWSSARPSRIEAPPAAAAAWRANAATETASVAAFAELSLQLLAHGAPPSLLRDAHDDALDEVRHAELCYGLAAALDGSEIGPAPFPSAAEARGPLDLPALAVEALVQGAYLESVSAEIARALSSRTEIAAIREILETIATDDARHAAHGWDVIAFCRSRGGAPVESALERAVTRLPTLEASLAPDAASGALEPFGIPGLALTQRCESNARAACLARIRAASQPLAQAA